MPRVGQVYGRHWSAGRISYFIVLAVIDLHRDPRLMAKLGGIFVDGYGLPRDPYELKYNETSDYITRYYVPCE